MGSNRNRESEGSSDRAQEQQRQTAPVDAQFTRQDNKLIKPSAEQRQAENAAFEAGGVVPKVTVNTERSGERRGGDEQPFVPGYTYTRKEAEDHFKELCKDDQPSGSDLEFMNAYNKKFTALDNERILNDLGYDLKHQAAPGDHAQERKTAHDSAVLQSGAKQSRFELGSEAEDVAWEQWQKRLNQSVHNKLQDLLSGRTFPPDTTCDIEYKVTKTGGYQWKLAKRSSNADYNSFVAKAVDDTLRYHPELLKFPEGARKIEYERIAHVGNDGPPGYNTGHVEREVRKR